MGELVDVQDGGDDDALDEKKQAAEADAKANKDKGARERGKDGEGVPESEAKREGEPQKNDKQNDEATNCGTRDQRDPQDRQIVVAIVMLTLRSIQSLRWGQRLRS